MTIKEGTCTSRVDGPTDGDKENGVYPLTTVQLARFALELRNGNGPILEHIAQYGDRVVATEGASLGILPEVYFLFDPMDVQQVWVGQQDKLNKTGRLYDAIRTYVGEGLFTMRTGERWKQVQKIVGKHFIPSKITDFDETIRRYTDQAIHAVDGSIKSGKALDIHDVTKVLSYQISARALLGRDAPAHEAEQITSALKTINSFVGISGLSGGLLEKAYVDTPIFLRHVHAAQQTLRAYAHDIATSDPRGNAPLLEALQQAGPNGTGQLTTKEMEDEIIDVLAAGHATTAFTLSWVLYLLGQPRHTHWQERIRTSSASISSQLAAQVIKETMRLYPPVYMTARQVTHPISYTRDDESFTIPRDAMVVISPWVSQRNPSIWPNPTGFDPTRFGEPLSPLQKAAYYPFGLGQRKCIGEHLAMRMAPAILYQMLESHTFVTPKEYPPLFLSTMRPPKGMELEVYAA